MTTRVFKLFAVGAISIVSLLVYRDLFGLWFTDVDTFPLIATGRIDSVGAAIEVLASPLMQGQMPNALFYRPLASIIWGVEELVWGMNPLGYHLVDLALHTVNSLLIFFFVRDTSQQMSASSAAGQQGIVRGDLAALVAALIFAAHPIAMESVPAIARRPDLLFALFLLLTLRHLAKALYNPRAFSAGLTILFCILALASKDSAVVMPAIAAAFVFCFSREASFANRVMNCLRFCWPLIMAAAVFMALRTIVLGGLGGYAGADSIAESASRSVYPYLCAFFFAGDLEVCLSNSRLNLVAAAAVVIASLTLCCWRVSRVGRDAQPDPAMRFLAFAMLSVLALFILHVAAGTAASLRTMYTALMFFSVVIGWGIVMVAQAVFGQMYAGRIVERALHVVAGVLLLVAIGGVLRGAWSGQYIDEWKVSADAAKKALADFAQGVESVPPNSVVYLVDFPFRVGGPLLFRERPILIEHSVQGFVDIVFPDKELDVVGLSYLAIDKDDPAKVASEVRFQPGPARLDIQTGPGGYAQRRPWYNPYAKRSPWRSNTYVRDEAERRLSIELNPEVDLAARAVFFIYLGDRVERRGIEAWTVAHVPVPNPD